MADEAQEASICRLCFGEEADGPLVQPCACRGSAKWAHAACLEIWRRTSTKEDAAYRCGQCKDNYRDALSLELLWRRLETEWANYRVTLGTLTTLACELKAQGKLNEASPLFRKARDAARATLGDRHPDALAAISNMASLLQAQGKLNEAEPLFREALDTRRETLGNRHPSTLASINNMASLLQAQGKLNEAEPLFREALDTARATIGDRHPDALASINNMASLLKAQGKFNEAEPLFREALDAARATLGDRHPIALASINNMASLLKAEGKLNEAEPLFREALDAARTTLGNDHPNTLTSFNNMASLLQAHQASKEISILLAWGPRHPHLSPDYLRPSAQHSMTPHHRGRVVKGVSEVRTPLGYSRRANPLPTPFTPLA